ncbi:UNKNOWN [Stylonychia lemnae]|uniref:Uncharacterized protein n=1 Tax=Stylonychia lemnae TaxID=5949 RepID=A0A077ZY93_STYLE|nr:UNKNOWN [Stylonychia lemnae]|eukprot:CDW74820.1 UNKNOWN [Stylonychia lemnae]
MSINLESNPFEEIRKKNQQNTLNSTLTRPVSQYDSIDPIIDHLHSKEFISLSPKNKKSVTSLNKTYQSISLNSTINPIQLRTKAKPQYKKLLIDSLIKPNIFREKITISKSKKKKKNFIKVERDTLMTKYVDEGLRNQNIKIEALLRANSEFQTVKNTPVTSQTTILIPNSKNSKHHENLIQNQNINYSNIMMPLTQNSVLQSDYIRSQNIPISTINKAKYEDQQQALLMNKYQSLNQYFDRCSQIGIRTTAPSSKNSLHIKQFKFLLFQQI